MQRESIRLSRRSLLASLALPAGLCRAAARTSRMHFGLTTYQWGADWDIPTIIGNCTKAKLFGVELRTSAKYAHGVEPDISPERRREVKKQFAGSPVKLVSVASSERFDWPDPDRLKAAIEAAKAHLKLSRDVGSSGVRVFPNDFHKEVPQEKTIGQIARAVSEVGRYAADLGQEVRLENHGSAGRLTTLRKVLDQVSQKNVRILLNSDAKDDADGGFARNFALVKDRLAGILHMHDFDTPGFPYQLQVDLLIDAGWNGWWLVEQSTKVADRVGALLAMRERWEGMVAKSLKR